MSGQFKYLFSPLTIGRIIVPNRISFSAHLTNFAEDCLPSERHVYYLATRGSRRYGVDYHGRAVGPSHGPGLREVCRGFQARGNPGIQEDHPGSP